MPGAGPIPFLPASPAPSPLEVVSGAQVLTEDILLQFTHPDWKGKWRKIKKQGTLGPVPSAAIK